MNGTSGTNHLGVNLGFTKFIFVTPRRDDETARTRLRSVGATLARGFFNDFEAEGARDSPSHDTIQFFVNDDDAPRSGVARARYAMQVSSKYRPRLQETEGDLRRRLGEIGDIVSLDGAVRAPQYTSAEMHTFAYKHASPRESGRAHGNVFILPLRKTKGWWEKSALDRHAYFYPQGDPANGTHVKGHARAAEAGISTIHRRLFYNPDGSGRAGEFDFITYFECADEHIATFDRVCAALRDEQQNPEWRFVEEGPEWRGRRVLRW